MKKYLFPLLLLSLYTDAKAQFYMQSGTTLYSNGVITLQNEDFIIAPGAGTLTSFTPGSNVMFTGNADNIISGIFNFYNFEIAKEGSHQVRQQDAFTDVQGQMVFTSGLFNLGGQILRLASTATLVNENENSRIIGPTGGSLETTVTLNQPAAVNPGNIGATITSNKNLGEITIDRHYVDAYALPTNLAKRYYSIVFTDPANDNNLNATLRLSYFDAELESADETKLVPWKREETSMTWYEQGPAANITRNSNEDWVQLTGINSLSNWTLAETSGTLPVEFTLFNVACENNVDVIRWETATEINTHHFEVQRSENGRDWVTIATINATGQNGSSQHYIYRNTASTYTGKVFYRIRYVDKDGRSGYTIINTSACGNDENWQVWPNPVQQQLYISLKLNGAFKTTVQLYDSKGSLVRQWQKELLNGNNRFSVDMQGLPTGTYLLSANWDGGRSEKCIKIVKQ